MMKKLFFVFFVGIILVSCNNDPKRQSSVVEANAGAENASANEVMNPEAAAVPSGPITSIKFDEMEYDFGTVKDGEKVTKIFKFTNTGKEPLVITNASASCGCTVPEWPKDAIAPGKSGEIKAVFDSKGKGSPEGLRQSKTIDITANTDPTVTNLRIFGTVVGQPETAQ